MTALSAMTSMERVITTLGHREPDRVPFFLLASMHGAKELDLSIEEYFSKAEHVVEGQSRLREKYHHDCLFGFFYAALELEAWGGETLFRPDGPPTAGAPLVQIFDEVLDLEAPRVDDSPCLQKVLQALHQMKMSVEDEVPIIGVVISPFSMPVMQMGFSLYLDLLQERMDVFSHLMHVNQQFAVEWANAQLTAGASVICYFDPMTSPTIIPPELYHRTGYHVAKSTVPRLRGPAVIHMASGASLPIIDSIAETGMAAVGVSSLEDLATLKKAADGKIALLGNLNGIEMRRWTPAEAEAKVKEAIAKAGPSGGFVLSDNHGEIPWQVPDEVLASISEAALRWGRYPLTWIGEDDG